MNKLQQLLLILMILTNPSQVSADDKQCTITKIIDGDTVWALCETGPEKIRMTIIDSFEKSRNNRAFRQAYQQKLSISEVVRRGKLATKYTTNELLNRFVIVVVDNKNPRDAYDRILGEIYFDGISINRKLLKKYPTVFLKY